MTDNEVISNEEMDALLEGVSDGSVETEGARTFSGEVEAFDINALEHIVRGRFPVLEMINERFAKEFELKLFELMRCPIKVSMTGVQVMKFASYLASMSPPISLNTVRARPLPSAALFTIDPTLVSALVDTFFGGTGRFARESAERDFSPAEIRMVNLFLEHAFVDLSEAWKPLISLDFKLESTEIDPKFVNINSPSENIIVITFQFETEQGSGTLQLALPESLLAPIRDLLESGIQADRGEKQEKWAQALREEINDAEVELSITLAETSISLRELIHLKPGDVIPIEIPATVTLRAGEAPVFRGKFGVSRGHNAIKTMERIEPMFIEDVSLRKTEGDKDV
jgi:flagellar motor switch protein FliM